MKSKKKSKKLGYNDPMSTKKYYEAIDADVKKLLELRKTDLFLYYITGDKKPSEIFSAQIHPEVLPFFYELLKDNTDKKKISLMLFSNGGVLEAPWPIVNLIREYSKHFEVIIPEKAHSAATLLSLGADKIIMTPLSTLSPIDPTGNFNIKNERKAIQVEDVFGFVEFAKDKVGLVEQSSLSTMLSKLVEEVPPSILGSTNRTQALIRQVAAKMLRLSLSKLSDTEINTIVEVLTQRLFSHQHMISRREAKVDIKLPSVQYATLEEEKYINSIFSTIKKKMQMDDKFDPATLLGQQNQVEIIVDRALVGSEEKTFIYSSKHVVAKGAQPGTINVNNEDIGWKLEK